MVDMEDTSMDMEDMDTTGNTTEENITDIMAVMGIMVVNTMEVIMVLIMVDISTMGHMAHTIRSIIIGIVTAVIIRIRVGVMNVNGDGINMEENIMIMEDTESTIVTTDIMVVKNITVS